MVSPVMFSSDSIEWGTPQRLYNPLNNEFHFTLDPCATPENAKCAKFYTRDDDGLKQSWAGEIVFVNPPYGKDIGLWIEKSYRESLCGATVVMLLPVRSDTKYFHDWILGKAEIRFIRGRLRFEGAPSSAPFPSMLAIYRPAMSGYRVKEGCK